MIEIEHRANPMTPLDCFDASRRDAAWALRGVNVTALAGRIELWRFHERPVGSHALDFSALDA